MLLKNNNPTEPTIQERYQHLRDNAQAFVESMRTLVAAAERDGDDDLASRLRVSALMPWEAALRDDKSGDLWPRCEACGKPIKDEEYLVSSDDECRFHTACVDDGGEDAA